MYAFRTQSTIWMEKYFNGDRRRNFNAIYVFDDGFVSRQAALSAVQDAGFDGTQFLYVRLNGQWYAVCIQGYSRRAVITKENVHWLGRAFGESEVFSHEEWNSRSAGDRRIRFYPDSKRWQDGIRKDLEMTETDSDTKISVCNANGSHVRKHTIAYNNVLVSLGIPFFSSEICIRTDSYVKHVFSHYYSDKSLGYMEQDIAKLRKAGIEYYNPFTKETSRTDREKNKKQRQRLKPFGDIPHYERPLNADGTKSMEQRELYADDIVMFPKKRKR